MALLGTSEQGYRGTTMSPRWTRGVELSPQPQASTAGGMLHHSVSCRRCRLMRLEVGRGRGGAMQLGLEQLSLPTPACVLQPCAKTGRAGWLAVGVRDSLSLITIR